jgi:hypothetical protein
MARRVDVSGVTRPAETPAPRAGAWLVAGAGVLLAGAAVLHPLLYVGMFAGDAEIHIVFGRNAAAGRFFEFNPGEVCAGETSPGYMLLVAALFGVAPEAWVPIVMKAVGLAAWYALVALVWVAARDLLESRFWASAAAGVVALMPGAAYNATIGMENGLFALAILAFWTVAIRTGWFEPERRTSPGLDAALGALLGLACWLRPEGFIVGVLALAVRGPRRSAVAAAAFAVVAAGVAAFHFAFTGRLLPGSALARVAVSACDAFVLGPVSLDPGFSYRLAAYAPLTVGLAIGTWIALRRTRVTPRAGALRFAVACFWGFFALYTAVLGSAHLGRYTIFLMPLCAVVACLGARWAWEQLYARSRALAAVAVALGAIALLGVFAAEAVARRGLGRPRELIYVSRAPEMRAAFSDSMVERLGRPEQRPIVVACQEVQIRYRLDDRFVVRSLDGRTDPLLLDYVRGGVYDHVGYLAARGVGFLLATPNYNRSPETWALDRLEALEPGESIAHGGLRFTRLPDLATFRVDPEP